MDFDLKFYRRSKKLTQAQLAKRLSVSSQVVSNWERGYTIPSMYEFLSLAIVLEIDLNLLISELKSRETPSL